MENKENKENKKSNENNEREVHAFTVGIINGNEGAEEKYIKELIKAARRNDDNIFNVLTDKELEEIYKQSLERDKMEHLQSKLYPKEVEHLSNIMNDIEENLMFGKQNEMFKNTKVDPTSEQAHIKPKKDYTFKDLIPTYEQTDGIKDEYVIYYMVLEQYGSQHNIYDFSKAKVVNQKELQSMIFEEMVRNHTTDTNDVTLAYQYFDERIGFYKWSLLIHDKTNDEYNGGFMIYSTFDSKPWIGFGTGWSMSM